MLTNLIARIILLAARRPFARGNQLVVPFFSNNHKGGTVIGGVRVWIRIRHLSSPFDTYQIPFLI